MDATQEQIWELRQRIDRIEHALKLIAAHAESPHSLADKLRRLLGV